MLTLKLPNNIHETQTPFSVIVIIHHGCHIVPDGKNPGELFLVFLNVKLRNLNYRTKPYDDSFVVVLFCLFKSRLKTTGSIDVIILDMVKS